MECDARIGCQDWRQADWGVAKTCRKMCGTLMTRLLLSRGMSSQLQLSSSCSVPEIGVNSILSPKSMTCSRTLLADKPRHKRIQIVVAQVRVD